MSQAIFTFRTITSRKSDHEIADYTLEKNESRHISKFQALGYLLCWVDALTEDGSDASRSVGSMFGFDAGVAALGFDPYDPVHILTAPNWKTRMLAAWSIIGDAERAIAAQLDYSDVHNYWPNTDFCKPDWNEEVKHWASCLTSYSDPSEFNICSWIGKPPRPELVFKA